MANKTTKKEESTRDSVTVVWSEGMRVYTRELHGEAFEALAKEFATKKGGKVV